MKKPDAPCGKNEPLLKTLATLVCPKGVCIANTIITIPTTIKAMIVTTFIIANQNSNSPNIFVLVKLNAINIKIHDKDVIQLGKSGIQNSTYFATAVISAIPDVIQVNQYVQPVTNPANGPI